MEISNLYLEPTAKTPLIDLNKINGELLISGKSIPENAAKVYDEVMQWVSEYVRNPRPTTNLRLNLEYFNTASSLWLAKIVKVLASIDNQDYTLLFHLYIHIEEYNTMDTDDLEETLSPFINLVGTPAINLCVKIYGIDDDGKILKESMVLI